MSAKEYATSEEYFNSLREAPSLALPTIALFIFVMSGIGLVWYYALGGSLPLWQGAIINGFLSY